MSAIGAAPSAERSRSELSARAAIALAGIAGTVWLLLATRGGFAALVGLALFAAGCEYRTITSRGGGLLGQAMVGLATLAAGAAAIAMARGPTPPVASLLVAGLVAAFGISSFLGRPSAPTGAGRGFGDAIAGPLYFGALPAFLLLLDRAEGAPRGYWVALALAVSWGGGIGGYVAGRLWGRRPLAPALSPRKTVEGAIGSFFLGSLLAAAVWATDRSALPYRTAVWLVPSAQALSQVGDLVESGLKRRCGVKESGRLLLAQGGILDSIDGFCLAAPWLYFASGMPWR